MSVLLRVAYDGTDFSGFARQPGTRTVQGTLEQALSTLYGQELLVACASRTDAGVHARGSLVSFMAPPTIPAERIPFALFGLLPADLSVTAAWREEHPGSPGTLVEPRFFNLGKHYRYEIRIAEFSDPLRDRYAWHLRERRALDLDRMRAAAARMVGTHDFAAFRAADCQASKTLRTVHRVDIESQVIAAIGVAADAQRSSAAQSSAQCLTIQVSGTAFLKNMVRIMVGTLIEVGRGRFDEEVVERAFATLERSVLGPTAPACGLCLDEVIWPEAGQLAERPRPAAADAAPGPLQGTD